MTASHLFIDLILICFIILVYIYRLAYQSKSRIFFDPTWSGLSSWFRSDCPVVRLHVKYLYLTCIHFGFAFETIAWKWTCWPLWGSLGPGWLRMLKIITLSRLICQHTLAASHMPMFNFSVTAQCLHTLLCHVAYSCVMKWRWCNDVPSQTLDINVIRLFSSFRSFQKKSLVIDSVLFWRVTARLERIQNFRILNLMALFCKRWMLEIQSSSAKLFY